MKQVRRIRRNLDLEVIAELSEVAEGPAADEAERKRQKAETMIRAAERVRAKMPRFMCAEAIDAAIKEGRT